MSMPSAFAHIYSNGSLLVLWGALLCHFLLPIPRQLHPIIVWRAFATQLSDKVNHSLSSPQGKLFGTLGWLLMILPAFALLIALKQLAWQSQLFDLALLLIALDWRATHSFSRQFTTLIQQQDKPAARVLLGARINRQTQNLSLLGLSKAGAETMIMAISRQVIAVLFWYAIAGAIGGAIGALVYRLMSELARVWAPSRAQFSSFGLWTQGVATLADFIPLHLFSVLIIMGRNLFELLTKVRTDRQVWQNPNTAWLLSASGHKLQLSLGGPAFYAQQKNPRHHMGGKIAPTAIHLNQLHSLLNQRAFIWLIIQSLMMLIHQGL